MSPRPLHTLSVGSAGPRVAFLHGLFGQGRNWSQIAKGLAGADGQGARCLLVDLPDHGRSPWTPPGVPFSFESYAASVASTLREVAPGEAWTVVGHSLGGKVAMLLALTAPEVVQRLCVVDIAPKGYGDLHRFGGYIAEMLRLPLASLGARRSEAEAAFAEDDPGVKAFLLQNLRREGDTWRWQHNLDLVAADAALGPGSRIAGFPVVPGTVEPYRGRVLWLVGGRSAYVTAEDDATMRALFPRVREVTVNGASHWVHTDAPEVVVESLRRFLHTSP